MVIHHSIQRALGSALHQDSAPDQLPSSPTSAHGQRCESLRVKPLLTPRAQSQDHSSPGAVMRNLAAIKQFPRTKQKSVMIFGPKGGLGKTTIAAHLVVAAA